MFSQWRCLALTVALIAFLHAPPARAQQELRALSLQELMTVRVTSVSRHSEVAFEAPAAVYALTSEEIRRSGARTIPEALRLVPGVEVARIDANKWAVAIRGFSGRFVNKLLVMIDGRTVYTPLFAGVYWNSHNLLLADVERIEVIRGPGGSLWGANAVNGVINIITRPSADTQGLFVEAGAGNEEHGFGSIRFGGTVEENLSYRLYATGFSHDEFVSSVPDTPVNDEWRFGRSGFRTDWSDDEDDDVTVQGDLYVGRAGQVQRRPMSDTVRVDDGEFLGANLLGRWEHQLDDGSRTRVQAYYDLIQRENFLPAETRHTFEVDFLHELRPLGAHRITWGAGYRTTADVGVNLETFPEGDRTLQLFNALIQDQVELTPDINLTFGSKFEHNDFTGLEIQPNGRLFWSISANQGVWGAVSRAVRTPSRGETDATLTVTSFGDPDSGLPAVAVFRGNPDLDSEELVAYEAGYRLQASRRFLLDAALFFNDYDELTDAVLQAPEMRIVDGQPLLVFPLVSQNRQGAEGWGGELLARIQPSDRWRLAVGYSYLGLDVDPPPAFQEIASAGQSPRHQYQIRSYLDLPENVELDTSVHFVDELPAFPVDSYTRWDVRAGWHPRRDLEISLLLRNLLGPTHQEFGQSVFETPSLVERSFHGKIRWRF